MKDMTFLPVFIGWMGICGLAFSQVATPSTSIQAATPITSVQLPTPVNSIYNPAPATKNEIKARIADQEARISADSKVGKLTTVQADALRANLQAIKDKKKADYAANGKNVLTSDQKAELNGMLGQNETSLSTSNGIKNSN
jgi:hypothetical protein